MNKMYRIAGMIMAGIAMMIFLSAYYPVKAGDTPPQIRALWVDAFRDGIKTPAQVDKLIQDSVNGNINTLIVQVRRRGDAYYNKSIEPRTEDPDLAPGFDALQYLIEKAHANGIQVHAWLNTLVAWNRPLPPKDPGHVWNLHGAKASDKDSWISYYRVYDDATKSWSQKLYSSYYLDPGNPAVVDYTTAVYMNIVKNYDVDGIHLDYSRYSDREFGYNPTSVARYNAQYGTTGLPAPDDPNWIQWRRDQTANLMRKIYLNAIAIKPNVKVSSAVITWGEGPVAEADWLTSRAYTQVYQDWRSWLEEGIIDMAVPMNYYSEWKPEQQIWYNHWIEWEKDHQYGRQIVIGPGIFMQYIEQSLDQIRRAQTPSAKGNMAAGVALYAYAASNLYSSEDFKESVASRGLARQPYRFMPETNDWFFHLLSQGGGYVDPVLNQHIDTKPVFQEKTAVPDMPWKSNPVDGYLMGNLPTSSGKNFDHVKITVDRFIRLPELPYDIQDLGFHREVYSDGSGWFGLAKLPRGLYQIKFTDGESGEQSEKVWVQPGLVSQVELTSVAHQQ
ncbi:MAG TPA: hypothetical protein DDW50_16845 [Firmicutes bacterium]|jgi:uncharacterized lipoprotein YddW (UPF0748 family)|nr:hypothetical protein [Bacillota bacterium]